MKQNMMEICKAALTEAGSRGMSFRRLQAACGAIKHKREFKRALDTLINRSEVFFRNDRYCLPSLTALESAVLLTRTAGFGFASLDESGEDIFIPGKFLRDALPGDKIILSRLPSRDGRTAAAVSAVKEEADKSFTGTLILDEISGKWAVSPDKYLPCPIVLKGKPPKELTEGTRIVCRITRRGFELDELLAELLEICGDSDSPAACADALIAVEGIHTDFTDELLQEADAISESGIPVFESDTRRLDLRENVIFTLDGADTKDIDDAVSVEKTDGSYKLGVHIADVSHYVTRESELEGEAFYRGTSIYFADRVIPMLPPALSNGICSLNEGEDRLALSCLMTISSKGELSDFSFEKTVIHSKLKGVYSEVNEIFSSIDTGKPANDSIIDKYKEVTPTLLILRELAGILQKNRKLRGSPDIDTTESKFKLDENGNVTEILPRTRGEAECIIEELMLLANQAAATLATDELLPFIFRVHAPPASERVDNLREILSALALPVGSLKADPPAIVLQKLIEDSRGTPLFPIVNKTVLRTMSKAEYHPENIGHYGLVLANYAQFTSPIRRYPDLVIHRIISEYISGEPISSMQKRLTNEVSVAAKQSTRAELRAQQLERECEACYRAAYMKSHIGECFEGIISHVADRGLFVELPSTVEGRISISDMPKGEYDFDGMFGCIERLSGKQYRVGDTVRVKCIGVNIASGRVDFSMEE